MSSDNEEKLADYQQSQYQAVADQQRIEDELNQKFPNRPVNRRRTLAFHVLYHDLFNPLTENLKRKPKAGPTGRQAGPHGGPGSNPHEIRRSIIERFISRWRREVGDDIFPAMRLIVPEKDRERAMYGLKEKTLARYLVKLMKIDKNSEDGFNLLNWKLPGQNTAARYAGDFAGRCFEVLQKRAHLIEPGNMTIAEVNENLDRLSKEAKEENQLPIMEVFYKQMNADEMTWLIKIITRNMKIGATERTVLDVWHPDAEALFNVSSSLRRVCWELYDPKIRLQSDERGVKLGERFQPQLAHQPNMSFTQMVASMKPTEDDPEFWIEEKLDGERMQLHVNTDPNVPGGKKLTFWSRHGKNYTYLYGDSFGDKSSALAQYIGDGLRDGVQNAILDGEMITWNMEQDVIVPFGTLKSAALAQQSNSQHNERPFYRVFDILLLNNQVLTRYTLRDRCKALEATVNDVHRRIEILPHTIGTTAVDIERNLRDVVTRASEGLVLKNPRAAYMLNARLYDWVKVKPEYMTEFGESLDCLIIGGYYGSGRRGGELSSFLCGLREDNPDGTKTGKFLSLFKVGGGMTTDDFAKLRHNTEGKWHKYDPAQPPYKHMALGGGSKQHERPDMWIEPKDSIVVEVKAASVNPSEDYAMGVTLRFPRFTRFRLDKNWESALSVEDFQNVRVQAEIKAEENKKEAKMQMNKRRAKTQTASRKKRVLVAGYDGKDREATIPESITRKGHVFNGLTFYVMTESTRPEKMTKIELEQLIKENGGTVVQSPEVKQKNQEGPVTEVVCVAERRTVKVASLEKRGKKTVVRPIWLFDCVRQAQMDFTRGLPELVLPLELDRHLFFLVEEQKPAFEGHVDRYGDSFTRATSNDELRALMAAMGTVSVDYAGLDKRDLLLDPSDCRGWMFTNLVLWFDDAVNDNSSLTQTSHHLHRRDHNSRASTTITTTNTLSTHESPKAEFERVTAAQATTRFAGATVVTSTDLDLARGGDDDDDDDDDDDERVQHITHVVLNRFSDKHRIRTVLARRKRLPRVVGLDWVEACWQEHTRIDEERFAVV